MIDTPIWIGLNVLSIFLCATLIIRFFLLRKKARDKIAMLDKESKLQYALEKTNTFFDQNTHLVQSIGASKPIAYTLAYIEYNMKDDSSQSSRLAGLSMLKLGVSKLYDLLIICVDGLYIIDNETNKWLRITDMNATKAQLTEIGLDQHTKAIKGQLPYTLHAYKLILETDSMFFEITFHNTLNYSVASSKWRHWLGNDMEKHIVNYLTGNYFLSTLSRMSPRMTVPSCFD